MLNNFHEFEELLSFHLWIPVSGFLFPDSGIRIPESGFRIPASGFRTLDFGLRIPDSGFRFPVFDFRSPGFRVARNKTESIFVSGPPRSNHGNRLRYAYRPLCIFYGA